MMHTALHAWHVSHHGRMVDFAGWDMPVQYTSIVAEHQAVRKAAGLFDIAHMGRLQFTGPDAARWLDYLLTCDVAGLSLGQVKYSLVCNEQGGILDDVLVTRFADHHLLVVNASNRQKILDWIGAHSAGFNANVEDQTQSRFMLAVQGPRAEALLQPLVNQPLGSIAYYFATQAEVLGTPAVVSRTGYTGEDGFEVILPPEKAQRLWERLLADGSPDVLPCGLGCRDTLRLEAAMPLYGHEMNEQTDPYTAGLAFGVKLDKPADFIGKAALIAAKAKPNRPKRVGLQLAGRRIAREGAIVLAHGQQTGHVTSGTFSPTLEKSIAMAYVPPEHAAPGPPLEVDIRGQREPATVVKLPFYKRP